MTSLLDYGLKLSKELRRKILNFFFMMCWVVRYEICKFGRRRSSQRGVMKVDWVCCLLEAFRKTSFRCDKPMISNLINSYQKWTAPLLNQLRLDVDVGCNVTRKNIVLRLWFRILRDMWWELKRVWLGVRVWWKVQNLKPFDLVCTFVCVVGFPISVFFQILSWQFMQ